MGDHTTSAGETSPNPGSAVGSSPSPAAVGPSPAPGTGSPATRTNLGRTGVILIVVIGLLYFLGWIAWAVFGPDFEVRVREHRGHDEQTGPDGPGRLTLTTPDGRAFRIVEHI